MLKIEVFHPFFFAWCLDNKSDTYGQKGYKAKFRTLNTGNVISYRRKGDCQPKLKTLTLKILNYLYFCYSCLCLETKAHHNNFCSRKAFWRSFNMWSLNIMQLAKRKSPMVLNDSTRLVCNKFRKLDLKASKVRITAYKCRGGAKKNVCLA